MTTFSKKKLFLSIPLFFAPQTLSVHVLNSGPKYNTHWEQQQFGSAYGQRYDQFSQNRNLTRSQRPSFYQNNEPTLELDQIIPPFPPKDFNFHQGVGHYFGFWISMGQIEIMSHLKEDYDETLKQFEEILVNAMLNLYEKRNGKTVAKRHLNQVGNLCDYLNILFKNETINFLYGLKSEGKVVFANGNGTFKPIQ
jgi:hypothetical protein